MENYKVVIRKYKGPVIQLYLNNEFIGLLENITELYDVLVQIKEH
jgi:hypothetical protein